MKEEERAREITKILLKDKLTKRNREEIVREIEADRDQEFRRYPIEGIDKAFVAGRITEYQYYDLLIKWRIYVDMPEGR